MACRECRLVKAATEFRLRGRTRRHPCRACWNAYRRRWNAANRQARTDAYRAKYATNPEFRASEKARSKRKYRQGAMARARWAA